MTSVIAPFIEVAVGLSVPVILATGRTYARRISRGDRITSEAGVADTLEKVLQRQVDAAEKSRSSAEETYRMLDELNGRVRDTFAVIDTLPPEDISPKGKVVVTRTLRGDPLVDLTRKPLPGSSP